MIRTIALTKNNRNRVLCNLVGLAHSIDKEAFANVNGPRRLNAGTLTNDSSIFHIFDQFGNSQTTLGKDTKYILLYRNRALIPFIIEKFEEETKTILYSLSRPRSDCEDKLRVELINLIQLLQLAERSGEHHIPLTEKEEQEEKDALALMDRYNRTAACN